MTEKKEAEKAATVKKVSEVVSKSAVWVLGVGALGSGIAFLQTKDLLFGLVLVGVGLVLAVAYQLMKKYF